MDIEAEMDAVVGVKGLVDDSLYNDLADVHSRHVAYMASRARGSGSGSPVRESAAAEEGRGTAPAVREAPRRSPHRGAILGASKVPACLKVTASVMGHLPRRPELPPTLANRLQAAHFAVYGVEHASWPGKAVGAGSAARPSTAHQQAFVLPRVKERELTDLRKHLLLLLEHMGKADLQVTALNSAYRLLDSLALGCIEEAVRSLLIDARTPASSFQTRARCRLLVHLAKHHGLAVSQWLALVLHELEHCFINATGEPERKELAAAVGDLAYHALIVHGRIADVLPVVVDPLMAVIDSGSCPPAQALACRALTHVLAQCTRVAKSDRADVERLPHESVSRLLLDFLRAVASGRLGAVEVFGPMQEAVRMLGVACDAVCINDIVYHAVEALRAPADTRRNMAGVDTLRVLFDEVGPTGLVPFRKAAVDALARHRAANNKPLRTACSATLQLWREHVGTAPTHDVDTSYTHEILAHENALRGGHMAVSSPRTPDATRQHAILASRPPPARTSAAAADSPIARSGARAVGGSPSEIESHYRRLEAEMIQELELQYEKQVARLKDQLARDRAQVALTTQRAINLEVAAQARKKADLAAQER